MAYICWFIAVVIYSGVFLGLWGLYRYGKRRGQPWVKWAAGVPAVAMLLLAGLSAAGWGFAAFDCRSSSELFMQAFDCAPSPEVSRLQAITKGSAISFNVYLRFNTSPEEFHRLVPVGFSKTSEEAVEECLNSPAQADDTPLWWKPAFSNQWLIYFRQNADGPATQKRKGFRCETEIFAYDFKSRAAYYHFLGID